MRPPQREREDHQSNEVEEENGEEGVVRYNGEGGEDEMVEMMEGGEDQMEEQEEVPEEEEVPAEADEEMQGEEVMPGEEGEGEGSQQEEMVEDQ